MINVQIMKHDINKRFNIKIPFRNLNSILGARIQYWAYYTHHTDIYTLALFIESQRPGCAVNETTHKFSKPFSTKLMDLNNRNTTETKKKLAPARNDDKMTKCLNNVPNK